MELHVERLLGKPVRGADGEVAGRIEELVARRVGGQRVVTEVHLGPHALLERLSAPLLGHPRGWKARWDQMDFSDPEHPRLRCTRAELERLDDDDENDDGE